jgi:hypothetical protein
LNELNPFVDDICGWVTKMRVALHAPLDGETPDARPQRRRRFLITFGVVGAGYWLIAGNLSELIGLLPWIG